MDTSMTNPLPNLLDAAKQNLQICFFLLAILLDAVFENAVYKQMDKDMNTYSDSEVYEPLMYLFTSS